MVKVTLVAAVGLSLIKNRDSQQLENKRTVWQQKRFKQVPKDLVGAPRPVMQVKTDKYLEVKVPRIKFQKCSR